MKLFKTSVIATLAVLLLCVYPSQVGAVSNEQIDSFVSNIDIGQDNVATITETITYNFGASYRHGIERFVPTKTKAAGTSKHYYYSFKFLGAAADGQAVKSAIGERGDYKVMRLGDPNRTINGAHTYQIRYQVWPVVEKDQTGDYLNWNLTGNNWEVPIALAVATVHFPGGANVIEARCYSGSTGSTSQDCSAAKTPNGVEFKNKAVLAPGGGLTANLLVPAGTVTNYLMPGYPPLWQWLPAIGFIVGVAAILIGVLRRTGRYLLYRYRLRHQLVIAQYEAPDGLSPGEIGLLNDNRSNMTEITATLIDLAVRGYLKIEQTSKKQLFKKASYSFHLRKGYSGLRDFEKELLDMLFDSGTKKTVALKDISAAKAASTIKSVRGKFKTHLDARGYYTGYQKHTWWRKLKHRTVWLVILLVIALNIYAWLKGASFGLCLFSGLAALFGILIGWVVAQRHELSTAGYQEWAKIEGLKLFLSVTEKARLEFHDAPAKNPKLFNKLLPYAIALGVERQWAKQFEGMDVSKDASWYSGIGPYTPYLLASSLSSDFSASVTSNFTPTQSSGGYSGGGFSGGGGGGGGGGSW